MVKEKVERPVCLPGAPAGFRGAGPRAAEVLRAGPLLPGHPREGLHGLCGASLSSRGLLCLSPGAETCRAALEPVGGGALLLPELDAPDVPGQGRLCWPGLTRACPWAAGQELRAQLFPGRGPRGSS